MNHSPRERPSVLLRATLFLLALLVPLGVASADDVIIVWLS